MKGHYRIFVLAFTVLFLLTTFSMHGIILAEESGTAGGPVVIYYDGKQLNFYPDSIAKINEIYYAPAEELASLTGWTAQIGASPSNPNGIQFSKDIPDLHVTAAAGQTVININGNERTISAAPEITNGIVMFPVRDFFYMMNCSVKWDKITGAFTVKSPLARVFGDKDVIARKAQTAPVINGDEGDEAWTGAEESGGFTTVYYNQEPQADTKFKVTYDNQAVYFFVKCESAPVPLEGVSIVLAPEAAIGTATPFYNAVLIPDPNDTTVAYDGTNRPGGLYVQYRLPAQEHVINQVGRRGTDITAADPYESFMVTSGFEAQYTINNDSWTAEAKIPYDQLKVNGGDPNPTVTDLAEWRLNVSRIRPFTEGASSWAPIRNSLAYDNNVGDHRLTVDLSFAPATGSTGSIFFEGYPRTSVLNATKECISAVPQNAGMRYLGYDTKMFFFDNEDGLDAGNTRFCAEWVNQLGSKRDELGDRYQTEILSVIEKDAKLYFTVKHPDMPNDGLYRLNIYADQGSGPVKKYEMMFDREQVMASGVVYNSYAVGTADGDKKILTNTNLKEEEQSAAVKKLISIIPHTLGYTIASYPVSGKLVYDYATAPNTLKIVDSSNADNVLITVTKTVAADGTATYTTTPDTYQDNGWLTVTTGTGKQIKYGYYQDPERKRYFLDEALDQAQLLYLNGQISSLAASDPLGAAWVLYETAKAYQDWMPQCDYTQSNYPFQFNWGPPYYFAGGLWNTGSSERPFAELGQGMQGYVEAYGAIRKTNALDIVSSQTGENAEDLLVEGMFKKELEYIRTYPEIYMNYEYYNWIGETALGKALNEPEYVHEVIDTVNEYTQNYSLLDGFWKEVTLSYHTQSFGGTKMALEALKGWSDPAEYISPRNVKNVQNLDMYSKLSILKSAGRMAGTVIYPNGYYYPIQDTWRISGKGNGETAADASTWNLGSILLPAANIARMSRGTGANTSQLYMTYAPQYGSHYHYDPLNLSFYSNGQELLPDLGYTHSQLHTWAVSTMSHNTVVVDSKDAIQPPSANYGGRVENYSDIDNTIQITKANEENAYPGVAGEYGREPWYIKMEGSDDSYVLDIFRVDGGSRHEYTLNGDGTSASSAFTANVAMTDYNNDTDAGNNDKGRLLPEGTKVQLPTRETETGSAVFEGENLYYGYIPIENVQKADLADGKYQITMTTGNGTEGDAAANTAGMKITGFAGTNSELFIGKAPSLTGLNKTTAMQNPKYYPKMVVRREGTNLQSTFVNVMEPYAAGASAKITSVEKLETANAGDVAVKVAYPCALLPGKTITDVIISNSDPSAVLTVGDITLKGKMAFIRYLDDKVASVYTVEADSVVVSGKSYSGGGKLEGKVVQTMRKAENAEMDAFIVNTAVPETAVGRTITITHPDGSVHAFTVESVTPQGRNTVVEISGGDPGFDIYDNGASKLLFYPNTIWKGDHTFKIAMETALDTGVIAHRAKQSATFYTPDERQNARDNINQGYSWAAAEKDNAAAAADIYAQKSFDELWNMVTPESINNGMGAALQFLGDAYLYTGDVKYGKAGLVLLDRIADIYPDMEFAGTAEECGLEQILAKAYDALYPMADDADVISYLSGKAAANNFQNPKAYGDWICKNIEDRILRRIRALSEDPQMMDNFGMQQVALATAAVVLDSNPETTEWLDFVFKTGGVSGGKATGGNITAWLAGSVSRDGMGGEGSPAYNMKWVDSLGQIADAMDGYAGYTKANLYEDPAFIKTLSSFFQLTAVGRYTIPIGDTDGTGLIVGLDSAVKYFVKTGDPIYAQYAYFLNNSSTFGLHSDIFTVNPENVAGNIKSSITASGTISPGSAVMRGYGFGIMRDGSSAYEETAYSSSFKTPSEPILPKLTPGAGTKISTFDNGATQLNANTGPSSTPVPIGGYLTAQFNIPSDGYYSIDIVPYKAFSYGIYDVYFGADIDKTDKIAQTDFYGSTGASSPAVTLTRGDFKSGVYYLKFVCVSKNKTATNNKMGLMGITLCKSTVSNDTQRDVWMYYGGTGAPHSHKDQLNLGLHAYGLDMAPDLGSFGENAGQTEKAWASGTLSHNTVTVDGSDQQPATCGDTMLFDDSDNVKVMDIESDNAYPQADVYRRSVVTVKASDKDSYSVDFFRVKGGNDRVYSFHSAAGTVETEGLNLTASTTGPGCQWLSGVRKDTNPSGNFSVDYDIANELNILPNTGDIHLRLTMLGEYGSVAVGTGITPQTTGGGLQYVLAQTTGSGCVFTSIIEPYENSRYIKSIEEAAVTREGNPVPDMEARAVKVTLESGRIDYIISTADNGNTYNVDGKFDFKGITGVYSEMNGAVITNYAIAPAEVEIVFAAGDNADSVTRNLTLPETTSGAAVSWSSSKPSVVASDGTVTRPDYSQGDAKVILTATARMESGTVKSRKFTLTVRAMEYEEPDDEPDDEQDNNSGSGGAPVQPPVTVPAVDTRGNITVTPKLDKGSGTAATEIDAATLDKAFERAAENSKGKRSVEIVIPAVEGAKAYEPTLPASLLTSSGSGKQVEIKTSIASVTLPGGMLNQEAAAGAGKVSLTIAQADMSSIDKDVRDRIGDRPVIQLSLKVDGKPYAWSNEDVPVSVSIPYKPTAQELGDPEHITIWYIDGNGNVVEVPSGRYDAATGTVTFSTTHFSDFAVVYVKKAFDDLGSTAWAKRQIEVLASKGILKGRTENEYAPQINITRAEFLYFLVRTLSVSAKADGNFDDVSSDAYYYKEIGIAKKLGITTGTGSNKFSPDAGITRQDMMVLTERALRAVGKAEVQGTASELDKFTDKSLIAGYALNSIASVVKEGLIIGSGGKVNPVGNTTRAEAAVLLYRIYSKY